MWVSVLIHIYTTKNNEKLDEKSIQAFKFKIYNIDSLYYF